MATRHGRNEPCPCGSGLKHKKCCGQREHDDAGTAFRYGRYILAGLIVVGAGTIGSYLVPDGTSAEAGAVAEPNRVWSVEHGHWHVIGGGEDGAGAAPPGKVWSPEHGHWHDAPVLERAKIANTALEDRLAAEFESIERTNLAAAVEAAEAAEDPAADAPE